MVALEQKRVAAPSGGVKSLRLVRRKRRRRLTDGLV